MKTFISDIFPKIQKYSQKLDNLALLTNQHWVSIDNILSTKTVYIFRSNKDLLISTDGRVEKAKWDYLGNKSLLIEKADESLLFKHGFFDENILALKIDSRNEYAVFVNENRYNGDLNSLDKVQDFLNEKYLGPALEEFIKKSTGHRLNRKDDIAAQTLPGGVLEPNTSKVGFTDIIFWIAAIFSIAVMLSLIA